MKTLFCAIALLGLTACTQGTTAPEAKAVDTTAADLKAIVDVENAAEKAWTAKNLDGIMAQYAAGATLVVPGAPVTKGPEAIRGMLSELLKDPAAAVEMEITNTEVSGGIGYQRGNYTLHVTDAKTKKPIVEKGTSLMIYKKQVDGSWKVVEDFNTALPAAQ
jgi:uncharacterized protein (TIGR02246 family)